MLNRYLKKVLLTGALIFATGAQGGVYEDMLEAVELGDDARVEALLKRGVDANTVGPKGNPLLTLAARDGKQEIVKTLLAARPNVNARNAHGETALMLTAYNGHLDVAKALLAAGAEVNHAGWTPLSYTGSTGDRPIADQGWRQGGR